MKFRSIALALALSVAAGAAAMAETIPPAKVSKDGAVIKVSRKKPADCHRDVRVHRIGGVMIRHRHVGDNCAVREVILMNGF